MRKLNMKKRTVIMAMAMLMAIGGMSGISSAANRGDQSFDLTFNSAGGTDTTSYRQKDDNSKVYIKVNKVKYTNNKVTGWVQGKKYSDSTTNHNCSGGYYYTLNKTGEQWMTNYVNEDGYGYARIKAEAPSNAPNVVEGVWSPDSGK